MLVPEAMLTSMLAVYEPGSSLIVSRGAAAIANAWVIEHGSALVHDAVSEPVGAA